MKGVKAFFKRWVGFGELQGERIARWFYWGGLVVLACTWLVYALDAIEVGALLDAYDAIMDPYDDYGELPENWVDMLQEGWWVRASFWKATFFTIVAAGAVLVLRLASELAIVGFRILDELRRTPPHTP